MPDRNAVTLLVASADVNPPCVYYGVCTTCTASGDNGCYVLPLLHSLRPQANAGLQSVPCRGLRSKASFMRAPHLGDTRGGHHGPGQTANALRSHLYCGLPHEPASLHAVGVLRSRQCSASSIGQAAICSTACAQPPLLQWHQIWITSPDAGAHSRADTTMCDRQQDGAIVLLGDPIVDVVCRTTGSELQAAGLAAGGCCPVDAAEMSTLMQRFKLTEHHHRCNPRAAIV